MLLSMYLQMKRSKKASALDKKRKTGNPIGKLHGVVIAIKDVICYKDHPLTAASGILKTFTSLYSATAIEKTFTGRSHHHWCLQL